MDFNNLVSKIIDKSNDVSNDIDLLDEKTTETQFKIKEKQVKTYENQ